MLVSDWLDISFRVLCLDFIRVARIPSLLWSKSPDRQTEGETNKIRI